LKLAIPDGSPSSLRGICEREPPVLGFAQRRHEVHLFRYPDQVFERGDVSLRVRAAGGDRIQTLKADRQAG
jgi:inorganic triphosphatase YgiF